MTRAASERRNSGSSVRINRQLAVTFTAKTRSQWAEGMWGRGERAPRMAALPTKHVETPEALIERGAERVDRLPVGEIERNEARAAADRADVVIDPPEIGHAAGEQQHMRAFAGEGESDGTAKPTRSAGNERDAILETLAGQPTSARKESCFCCGGPSRSRSLVGYSPVKQWSVNCGWAASRPS